LLLTRKLLNQGFLLVKLKSSLRKIHKWPRICSTCRKHNLVLFSFMPFHWVCNTKGGTSWAGTAPLPVYLSSPPIFTGVRITRSLVLCVMFCCFVDRCFSFVLFLLSIVLSVRLLFVDSDYLPLVSSSSFFSNHN
jgi:hypothetical protein